MSTAVGKVLTSEPSSAKIDSSVTSQCQCCLRTSEHESLRGWLLDIAAEFDADSNAVNEWNKSGTRLSRNPRHESSVLGIIRRQAKEVKFHHAEDNREYMEMYRRHKETRNSSDKEQMIIEVQKMVDEIKNKLESNKPPSPTTKPPDDGKYFQILAPNESPLVVQRIFSSPQTNEVKIKSDPSKQKVSSQSEEENCLSKSSSLNHLHSRDQEEIRSPKPPVTARPGSNQVFSHFAECVRRSRNAQSTSSANRSSSSGRSCLRLACGPKSVDLMSSIHLLSSNGHMTGPTLPVRSHTVIGIIDRQHTRSQGHMRRKSSARSIPSSNDYTDRQLAFPCISHELRKSFQIRGERASTAGTVRPSLRREPLIVSSEAKSRTRRQCPRSAVSSINRRQSEDE